jgi:hypothetical protein
MHVPHIERDVVEADRFAATQQVEVVVVARARATEEAGEAGIAVADLEAKTSR